MKILTSLSVTAISRLYHLLAHGSYIPTDYYVLDDIEAVYVSIPKVACTSIKTALLQKTDALKKNINDPMAVHGAANKFRKFSLSNKQQKYYVFAFVRNPFDRLVSCYEDKVRREIQHSGQYHFATNYNNVILRRLYGRKFHPKMSFHEFVSLVADIPDYLSDGHFRSQYSFLYHRGKALTNYVGKFENIADDWSPIAQKLGLPQLTHRNTTTRQTWRQYYTDEKLVKLVTKRYAKDIEYFNYSAELSALSSTSTSSE